ncbi:MAG: DUF554 domain-containing protein [Pseudanabaena sp. ELA607]|jgi:uncharacterized membrane protein YqgA involved in biofilm formation
MLDFWAKTSGTWVNVATIIVGTTVGLLVRGRLRPSFQKIITQSIGLITMFISLNMAQALTKVKIGFVDGTILALALLIVGGICGEWWQIEERLELIGDWLKGKFQGSGKFTEGFVTTSLLYCIGPMAILGSLNNGLFADPALLNIKAALDGLISVPFTSTYGIGVGFSALSVLVYQGTLSLLAGTLTQFLPQQGESPVLHLVGGLGGIILVGLSLNLLEITQIRIASYLPALLLAPVVYQILHGIMP